MLYKDLDYSQLGVVPWFEHSKTKETVSMKGKNILIVMGDGGGANMVTPILPLMLGAGARITLYLVGICAKQYTEGTRAFDERINVHIGAQDIGSIDAFLSNRPDDDLLIICASNAPYSVTTAQNMLSRTNAMVVMGMQDMYISLHPNLRNDMWITFEKICVSDGFSEDLMIQEFPGLENRTIVTGNPGNDSLLRMKATWTDRRQELRKLINASDTDLVVTIVGGRMGTTEMMKVVQEGIIKASARDRVKIIFRPHSRATDSDKESLSSYLQSTSYLFNMCNIEQSVANSTDDLLPATDIVVGVFGTTLSKAVMLEMQRVVYVGTPQCSEYFTNEKGLQRPPEVERGAAWYAQTSNQMARLLTLNPLSNDQDIADMRQMRKAQREIAKYLDGHSTARVFQEIERQMQ